MAALTAALPTAASEATDPVSTGAIHPAPPLNRSEQGSVSFRAALEKIDTDRVKAYEMAKSLTDPVERRTIQWAAIYFGKGEVDYQSVLRFQADAPHYASAGLYKTRMEQALTKAATTPAEVIEKLGGQMPNTLDAQIALARAYLADGQAPRAGNIIRAIWTTDFLNGDYEQKILGEFGSLLKREDHWNRAVHLLMHDRARGTERIMDKLSPAQQTLARARMAVSRGEKHTKALFDKVDPAYRDHPLFHFTRGQDARHKGQLADAVRFLDMAKGDVPDAAEFWYERRLIARRALAAGNAKRAFAAAAGYTEGPEGRLVEARFHAGWIALKYLEDAETARKHFEQMRALSTLPESITQAQYWLGKSLQALGQREAANTAFAAISDYHTLYYGQLARLELGIKTAGLRDLPEWEHVEAIFEDRELVKAVRLLDANRRPALAEPLLRHLALGLKDPGELLLAARLAQKIDAHNIAILIADIADKRGVALDLFNFPRDGLPPNAKLASVDRSAVYAIARQESRFDIDAISRSGARGLMQLMPATAKEVAGRLGVSYSSSRLTSDPAYNALLGSAYLASQLDRYDGSLILAAAAYNAGAGNVNKWIKSFGDPRQTSVDPVSWVEAIPFLETRKYVQRVLGNYMIYRAREGDESLTIQQALRRIPH